MNALLTPEQIEEIRTRDVDYVDELPRTADIGTKDRRALLRDREAICERLEGMAIEYEKRKQAFYDDLRNVHGDLCSDVEDDLRSLLSELRGGK